MGSARLEAFSDGVFAIIITIMVLELRPPEGTDLDDLRALLPNALAYVLSFVMIGIYWNNHHHLMHAVARVDGSVLWANLHLLFWLSLFPFGTAWTGEHHRDPAPVMAWGAVMLGAAIAYLLLVQALLRLHGPDSTLARAIGRDRKGIVSGLAYVAAVPLALISTWISLAMFVGVALVWLVPDRRITHSLEGPGAVGEPARMDA
jgi:uncharacterized membrane protein